MRYIRTNQIMKSLYKNEMWRYKEYKDSRRVRKPQNVTIAYGNKTFVNESGLDQTFKWHREYNNVSFDVTHYYPHEMIVPLYVDLYKEDSVYY